MSSVERAYETQLTNIQKKSGKTLEQLYAVIRKSGLSKHGEIRTMLKEALGLGHGDANTLTHFYLQAQGGAASTTSAGGGVLDEIYSGPKAELRPLHEKVMAAIEKLGEFEVAPKKGYVSLRRKKQFAMVGPASKGRLEVGLNMKGVKGTARLVEQPAGGMCQYKVQLTTVKEVDKELLGWLKQAFESAG